MLRERLRAGPDLPCGRRASHSRRTGDGRHGAADEHVRHSGAHRGAESHRQAGAGFVGGAGASRERREEYEYTAADQGHEAARFAASD